MRYKKTGPNAIGLSGAYTRGSDNKTYHVSSIFEPGKQRLYRVRIITCEYLNTQEPVKAECVPRRILKTGLFPSV